LQYQSLRVKPSTSAPSSPPIGLLASQVVRSVRQLVTAQVEPLGLNSQQFWSLVAIAEQTSASQAELAARLRVDEATTCRVVRTLGDAALVAAVRDPEDRRRVRLELTPEGAALARRLLPVVREIRGAIENALTPDEREATRAGLIKVLARLGALVEARGAQAPAPATPRRSAPARPARPRAAGRIRSPLSSRGSP
jgi:DNA-binding MarR family transcriptional regulator